MEQIENEEIDLHKYVHLLLNKGTKHFQEIEISLSVNGAGASRYPQQKQNTLN